MNNRHLWLAALGMISALFLLYYLIHAFAPTAPTIEVPKPKPIPDAQFVGTWGGSKWRCLYVWTDPANGQRILIADGADNAIALVPLDAPLPLPATPQVTPQVEDGP